MEGGIAVGRLVRRWSWLGVGGLGLGLLLGSFSPGIALAHGKEITIEVSALTPDPQQPRTKLYRALVTYSDDKEPVIGAEIYLAGQRRAANEVIDPIRLAPLNAPGLYAAQVTYPRYGNWEMKLEAKGPGQGRLSFVDEVLPRPLVEEIQSAGEEGQSSVFTLSLSFDWRDVVNLVMRWVHSLAAVGWFGLSGLIVAAFGLLQGGPRARFLGRLSTLFPLAVASLALLAGTGIYNAIYNSPLRPPGVFSLEVMELLPYGTAYLVVVGLKAFTVILGAGLALRLAKGLKMAAALPGAGNPEALEAGDTMAIRHLRLLPLAAANLALGLAMLLGVAVMAYLHNLSHLAVLVPGR